MYTYYAVRAMRFRTPRWVSIFITSIQIMQMAMGLTVNYVSYRVKTSGGRYCQQSFENMRYCTAMYLSYFFLFVYFFYVNYVRSKKALTPQTVNAKEALSSKIPQKQAVM
jgi:elongation of very long chain fatty acids protein 6